MFKTICSISRSIFTIKAPRTLDAMVAGKPLDVDRKEFSTGTLGWYANGKCSVMIDGKAVPCQVQISVYVIGSKELPAENDLGANTHIGAGS